MEYSDLPAQVLFGACLNQKSKQMSVLSCSKGQVYFLCVFIHTDVLFLGDRAPRLPEDDENLVKEPQEGSCTEADIDKIGMLNKFLNSTYITSSSSSSSSSSLLS